MKEVEYLGETTVEMKDIIEVKSKELNEILMNDFINNHQKYSMEVNKKNNFFYYYYYLYFDFYLKKCCGNEKKYRISFSQEIFDEYQFFSNGGFFIYLESVMINPTTNYEYKLADFKVVMKPNGLIDAETKNKNQPTSEIENIVISYVNEYIKKIYAKKLDEVNKKFFELEKTLSKLKDKIQKREDPVDVVKYQQTFEIFQQNLKEFEGFLNVIKNNKNNLI